MKVMYFEKFLEEKITLHDILTQILNNRKIRPKNETIIVFICFFWLCIYN